MATIDSLDNQQSLQTLDKQGMLTAALSFPDLLLQAQSHLVPQRKIAGENFKQIVITGMGGSAISGDIAASLLGEAGKPVFINRDYHLPSWVGPATLLFALSYSGNTEETLQAVKQAQAKKAEIYYITSGGKLLSMARENGQPVSVLPTGYQPRAALPFLLTALLRGLEQSGFLVKVNDQLNEAVELLQKLRNTYTEKNSVRSNPAKQLARKLAGKTPLILASAETFAAGLRMKGQFNENSKQMAFLSIFPELNHNEIVGLYALKREAHNFYLLLLRDEGDPDRIQKRMEITKSLLARQAGGIHELFTQGKGKLAKLLSLIYLADVASVYLALLQGIDPTPVLAIDKLKKELSR